MKRFFKNHESKTENTLSYFIKIRFVITKRAFEE